MSSASSKLAGITLVPHASLHVSKPTWWLESRFHFNFANFHDGKEQFGPLRVLNDDLVKAHSGFGAHPHRDAEIFSYVVSGELSHQDSMGNIESLGRGAVQYLSAGKGIVHSEMNNGDKTCRFLQTWFLPDKSGHKPQYGSRSYTKEDRHNVLLQLLGGTGNVPKWSSVKSDLQAAALHQDSNIFVSESDAGVSHKVVLDAGRQIYMVCIEGALKLGAPDGEITLAARDAVEIVAGKKALHLDLTAGEGGSHFMLMEMTSNPSIGGW